MTNKLPRARLSDVALSISLGDYAAAAALLGRDEDFLSSAVVAQYRGLTAAGLGNLPAAEAKLREALALLALRADGAARPDDAEIALYAKGAPKGPTPVSPALEAIAPHVALLLVRRSLVFTLEAFGETDKAEAERRLLPEEWRP